MTGLELPDVEGAHARHEVEGGSPANSTAETTLLQGGEEHYVGELTLPGAVPWENGL